jgi:hypothetical protein
MQQNIHEQQTGFAIQASWKDGAIELTMGDMRKNAHRLSAQQARALACDLIQRAYQAETNMVLKQRKNHQ